MQLRSNPRLGLLGHRHTERLAAVVGGIFGSCWAAVSVAKAQSHTARPKLGKKGTKQRAFFLPPTRVT
jgi:hypothetical protein